MIKGEQFWLRRAENCAFFINIYVHLIRITVFQASFEMPVPSLEENGQEEQGKAHNLR